MKKLPFSVRFRVIAGDQVLFPCEWKMSQSHVSGIPQRCHRTPILDISSTSPANRPRVKGGKKKAVHSHPGTNFESISASLNHWATTWLKNSILLGQHFWPLAPLATGQRGDLEHSVLLISIRKFCQRWKILNAMASWVVFRNGGASKMSYSPLLAHSFEGFVSVFPENSPGRLDAPAQDRLLLSV